MTVAATITSKGQITLTANDVKRLLISAARDVVRLLIPLQKRLMSRATIHSTGNISRALQE